MANSTPRLDVKKTYKLFIGGAFPRSESGRTYEVKSAKGAFIANPSLASRKDLRDAVVAARAAHGGWSSATAFNRGQILYRIAEIMEGRTSQFIDEIVALEGVTPAAAKKQVEQAIDLWVWYSGWCDKIGAIYGSTNAVSGSFYNFTIPESLGVVATFAPEKQSLLGAVQALAPILAGGNTAILIASIFFISALLPTILSLLISNILLDHFVTIGETCSPSLASNPYCAWKLIMSELTICLLALLFELKKLVISN
jgi:hypothetical protein